MFQRELCRRFQLCYSVFVLLRAARGSVDPLQPKTVSMIITGTEGGFTDEASLTVPSESSTCAGVFSSSFSRSKARSSRIRVIPRFARSSFTVNMSFSASTSMILRFRSLHFVRYLDSSVPVYGA